MIPRLRRKPRGGYGCIRQAGAEIERCPKLAIHQHWRRRAEEVRTLADELTDPESKRNMLKIAEDYETLAIRAEQRLHGHSSNEGAA
jgi:hypothetical protein